MRLWIFFFFLFLRRSFSACTIFLVHIADGIVCKEIMKLLKFSKFDLIGKLHKILCYTSPWWNAINLVFNNYSCVKHFLVTKFIFLPPSRTFKKNQIKNSVWVCVVLGTYVNSRWKWITIPFQFLIHQRLLFYEL